MMTTNETTFTVRRLTVAVPSVRGFEQSYEAAVPDVPLDQVMALLQRGAPWSDMLALITASAPHGFLIYARTDVHPWMHAAGDEAACITYLMGNRTIAERMFRRDPRAMLYAPLRTVIGKTRLATRGSPSTSRAPSSAASGFPKSARVGVELDRMLAALLQVLDVDVPGALLQS